jgi:signal transduction histidine kinase
MDPPRWEVDRADGTTIEIHRARMPDGGYVTTYSDITDRKQAEKAELARLEAEAANNFKSEFLRNMGHDLRKPLVAIIGYIKLVLDKSEGQLAPRLRSNLENAEFSADHLHRMVDEILEMSRIEAGEVEARFESAFVDPVIEGILLALKPAAMAKGLRLTAKVEDRLRATTDPRLLSRIVMNLTGNAVEYTDTGDVTITAGRRGDALEIAIADTGKGIPAGKLEAIFEKFQQVEPLAGIVKPGMGIGLGLSISKEFARLLGGEIAVTSEQGSGSTFTLSIPFNGLTEVTGRENTGETSV